MEDAANLVGEWIADTGAILSDVEQGELVRRIASQLAGHQDPDRFCKLMATEARAGFDAGWNSAIEESAMLVEDWMERNELIAPIASAIRKMKPNLTD